MWQPNPLIERRDSGFLNTWRRLLLDLSALPPLGLSASLVLWTLLLWRITPASGLWSPESRISAKHCNVEPILAIPSVPDYGWWKSRFNSNTQATSATYLID